MKPFEEFVFASFTPAFDHMPFRVRSTGHFCIFPLHKQKVRICSFVELFWCIEGSCQFKYAEGVFPLRAGEVCFYNTGCKHDYMPDAGGFHYRWLSIEGPMAEQLFQGFQISPLPRYAGSCPTELFELLENQLASKSVKDQYEALATGFKIWTRALVPKEQAIGKKHDYATIAKRVIDETFTNPDTTVNFLADQLQLHRVYLSRIFKQKHHIPISEYLLRKKLDYAAQLLITTTSDIKTIAGTCGFSDSSYFLRFFKCRTGCTPTEYRKQKTIY